jgi:bacillithiol system protein YtxJ
MKFGMSNIPWNRLEQEKQLDELKEQSAQKVQLIFKHSTRCSISAMALERLERGWRPELNESIQAYYLDLINYRPLSDLIAEKFEVRHESPQVLLIHKGDCSFDSSHFQISMDAISLAIKKMVQNI